MFVGRVGVLVRDEGSQRVLQFDDTTPAQVTTFPAHVLRRCAADGSPLEPSPTPAPAPAPATPDGSDDGAAALRDALAAAPRVALDLLAAALLQPEAAVTIRPALGGTAPPHLARAHERNETVRQRLHGPDAMVWTAAAVEARTFLFRGGRHQDADTWQDTPVQGYMLASQLSDAELWRLLARLTIARVGGRDSIDAGASLASEALADTRANVTEDDASG